MACLPSSPEGADGEQVGASGCRLPALGAAGLCPVLAPVQPAGHRHCTAGGMGQLRRFSQRLAHPLDTPSSGRPLVPGCRAAAAARTRAVRARLRGAHSAAQRALRRPPPQASPRRWQGKGRSRGRCRMWRWPRCGWLCMPRAAVPAGQPAAPPSRRALVLLCSSTPQARLAHLEPLGAGCPLALPPLQAGGADEAGAAAGTANVGVEPGGPGGPAPAGRPTT